MKMLLVVAIVLGFNSFASAAPASGNQYSPGGSDGCGLGWQVTDKKSFLATTTRGTTNSFVPPTFGITSGTIGCEQHSFTKVDYDSAVFARNNIDTLKIEMAEGKGETLEAFAAAMSCDSAAFGTVIQSNFSKLDMTSPMSFVQSVKVHACNG